MKLLKNKKGFTLIELLAVIIILGVLMALAIPSMTQLIDTSRKKTYVTTAQSYIRQARYDAFSDIYPLPEVGKYIVIPVSKIELESGQKKSPFGSAYKDDQSYVIILNDGVPSGSTTGTVKYFYFVAMLDGLGNGVALKEENSIVPGDIIRNNLNASITKATRTALAITKAQFQTACNNGCSFTQSSYQLSSTF